MTEPKKEPEEQPELGYACICGWKTTDKEEFTSHCMFQAQKDGKGTHKSLGRVDMQTGEVVMPPDAERTPEQKQQSKTRLNKRDNGGGGGGGGAAEAAVVAAAEAKKEAVEAKKEAGAKPTVAALQVTKELADAQQLRMVPKVFTAGYTPIMRVAQDAAVKYFGWRPDMPFENFIDTVLYLFFKEKGITLVGYVVDDSLLPKEEPDNGN